VYRIVRLQQVTVVEKQRHEDAVEFRGEHCIPKSNDFVIEQIFWIFGHDAPPRSTVFVEMRLTFGFVSRGAQSFALLCLRRGAKTPSETNTSSP
jgi:hypothetical protein